MDLVGEPAAVLLWVGRAQGHQFLKLGAGLGPGAGAQALAPLLFGAVSDYVFGGGRFGLQWTFVLMLVPLAASVSFLYNALRTYPRDVATAAASTERAQAGRA